MSEEQLIQSYINARESFPAFLNFTKTKLDQEELQILSTSDQFTTISSAHKRLLCAWIAWTMNSQQGQSIVWLKRNWRNVDQSPVNTVAAFFDEMEEFRLVRSHTNQSIRLVNDSVMSVSGLGPCAGKGFSISHLIVEDVEPESLEWHQLMMNLIPVVKNGKVVTIKPELD